jgi:3-hydroxyacyl-CoA dehydrogenase
VYAAGKKEGLSPEARPASGMSGAGPGDEEILDQLLLPMVNEAARCLEEGVVRRPLDVDLGMVMGTGFPPFRGGLLRYADRRGVARIVTRLRELAQASGARLAPSEALQRISGFYRAT